VAELGQGLERAWALSAEERTGRSDVSESAVRRKALRRKIRKVLAQHVALIAERAAAEAPDLAGRFAVPGHNAAHAAFLNQAQALRNGAVAVQDLLAKHGLSPAVLDDLGRAVAELEGLVTRGSSSRQAHVGARAALESLAPRLLDTVDLLETLTRYRFEDDPKKLAAWVSARRGRRRNRKKKGTEGGDAPPAGGAGSVAA
jgi:hypothetical protein